MHKILWHNTREWHHKCEEHPVGAAMSEGNPPREWYTSWLATLYILHSSIDNIMPECAHRASQIQQDIDEMNMDEVFYPETVLDWKSTFENELVDIDTIEGFAYVLTGAHLMGGEIMRRRLEGFPVNHLMWDDRKETLAYLETLRHREELTRGAVSCFKSLYRSMEEIQHKFPQNS